MRIAMAVVALSALSAVAGAQANSQGFVRVTAHDSSGAPIPDAEVTVHAGLKDVVAQTRTDSDGHAVLSVPAKDSTDYSLTMRKIGYVRGDRFFAVAPQDTAVVNIVVPRPSAATLAPMKVTAAQTSNYYSYDLYADEIENASGWMADAWDVVKRMRPDMLTSRRRMRDRRSGSVGQRQADSSAALPPVSPPRERGSASHRARGSPTSPSPSSPISRRSTSTR